MCSVGLLFLGFKHETKDQLFYWSYKFFIHLLFWSPGLILNWSVWSPGQPFWKAVHQIGITQEYQFKLYPSINSKSILTFAPLTLSINRLSLAPLCLATLGAPLPGHHVSSQAIFIMTIIIVTSLFSCRLVGNILHSFALVKYSQLSRRLLRDWSDGSKRDLCSPTWQPACWPFPLWPGGRK